MTEEIILKGYDKIKDRCNKFYTKKIHDNPEFYQQEKIRVREFNKNRYKNDPEFAEKLKEKARLNYKKKKALLAVK